MAESGKSEHSSSTGGKGSSQGSSAGGGAIPAWKLRESAKKQADKSKRSSLANKIARKTATIDPNLPPAFKQVAIERLAFKRQQERRKNNDEFVSLNSTHVGKEEALAAEQLDDMSSLGDGDSFGDSFDEEEEYQEE